MTIASAATAFPKHHYRQEVLLSAFVKHWGPRLDNPKFLERLHARVGVDSRNLVLPMHEYVDLGPWGKANNHWIESAQELGQQSLCCALNRAGFAATDINAIFFVSVTGVAS